MTRHPLEPTRTLLLALASLFPLGHNAAVAQEATYRLRFEEDAPRLLHVEADLPTTQNLTIGGGHPEPERERWGDYVDGLEITSEDGTPIRWSKSGDNAWSLSGPIPERIRVRYRVRLDHDQVRRGALRMWPPGVDEATYVSGGAVFFRTYAVLMTGAFRSFSSARLFLDLPAGWNVTTNLSPVDGRSNERFTDDLFQFFGAGLMLGTHQTAEVVVDQVNLDIGVANDLPGAIDALIAPFQPALEEARAIFGGAPTGNYAIIAAHSSWGPGRYKGSGLTNGMAVLPGDHPAQDPTGVWTVTLIHELLHMWVGSTLRRSSQDDEWFIEGVNEYVTMLTASRRGLTREDVLLRRLGTLLAALPRWGR